MSHTRQQDADAMALDRLRFMADKAKERPLLSSLILNDIDHWHEIADAEKPALFERDVRRFCVFSPTLAQKDSIRHAAEALRRAARGPR